MDFEEFERETEADRMRRLKAANEWARRSVEGKYAKESTLKGREVFDDLEQRRTELANKYYRNSYLDVTARCPCANWKPVPVPMSVVAEVAQRPDLRYTPSDVQLQSILSL